MGKISQGILGGFSGAVGNVVGASWKGIDYIRIKPDHITNPRTPAQVAQRTKFKTVVLLAKPLLSLVIRDIWNKATNKMSGFNFFTKTNLPAVADDGTIDYSQVKVAIGERPAEEINASYASGTLTVTWSAGDTPEEFQTDKSKVVILREGKSPSIFTITGQRVLGTAEASITLEADETAHVYLFFLNESGDSFSPSAYASVVAS